MRDIKYKFWDSYKKQMIYHGYEHADCYFHGLLVCEGDTIPLQWTGLKDKNGKDIYEGDIVFCGMREKDPTGWTHEVVAWNNKNASFDLVDKKTQSEHMQMVFNPELIIVRGNIYEDPELLKSL